MAMYKKILIPTDGSALSTKAAHAGIELARQCNAEVVGVHVAPVYQYPVNVEIIVPSYPSEEEYRIAMLRQGENYLDSIRKEADSLGVTFSGTTLFSDKVASCLIQVAEEQGCDLIFIGSHGRSGLEQFLLGSVTNKILSSCRIPVLVYR